jgi:hypothetical protein
LSDLPGGVRYALCATAAILLVLGVMQLSANKASENGT